MEEENVLRLRRRLLVPLVLLAVRAPVTADQAPWFDTDWTARRVVGAAGSGARDTRRPGGGGSRRTPGGGRPSRL